jgi:hypothetical protein
VGILRNLSFLVVIGLAGCKSSVFTMSQPSVSETLLEQKAKEEVAWREVRRFSMSRCNASPLPPAREEAVIISNCVSKLVDEYVLPEAAFPELIAPSRKEALHMAEVYAGGKMTPFEYRKQAEARLKKYHDAWALAAERREQENEHIASN